MGAENFLSVEEHFDRLVAGMDKDSIELFRKCKNTRVETAFKGRTFIFYEIANREAAVLETLTVEDFSADETVGASTEVRRSTGETLVVSYAPVRMWEFPVFMHVPLHTKLRWAVGPRDIVNGSLGFPLCVRTLSRLHLRERGVVYCETGVSFAREFEQADVI